MKKIKYLFLSLISILLITGCGKQLEPKEVLKEAFENMEKLDSVLIKLTIYVKEFDESSSSYNYSDYKNKKSLIVYPTSESEENIYENSYSVAILTDSNMTTEYYLKSSGWIKGVESTTEDPGSLSVTGFEGFASLLEEYSVEKVEGKKDTYKIINNSLEGEVNEIEFTVKNKRITKMSYGTVSTGAFGNVEGSTTYEYSEFNKVKLSGNIIDKLNKKFPAPKNTTKTTTTKPISNQLASNKAYKAIKAAETYYAEWLLDYYNVKDFEGETFNCSDSNANEDICKYVDSGKIILDKNGSVKFQNIIVDGYHCEYDSYKNNLICK